MDSPSQSRSGYTSDPISLERPSSLISPISSVQSQLVKPESDSAKKANRRLHDGPGKSTSTTATSTGVKANDTNAVTKELTRGAPTDGVPIHALSKSSSHQEVAKKRSQYFNDVFTDREPYHTPRHRINQDSIVVIEVKTNTILQDDFQSLSELSFNLAQIFQRPETSILLYVEHNCCLMLGSNYEPAYLATVSALPYSVAPIMNLRHTVLIQTAINDTLGIPSSRGVIKFEPMAEENFATNGSTIRDEIEQLERSSNDEHGNNGSMFKSMSRTRSRNRKVKSNTSSHGTASVGGAQHTAPTPSSVQVVQSPPPTGEDNTTVVDSFSPAKMGLRGRDRVIKKCQSVKQFFFR
ncbi:hypothetical protein ACO22_03688 [Paracoccidioides brasiliensis]|uniref:L-dopachrome isomerase n=1 Tax=Paracoccidioides brasiliensis TaxID=121759 RepID=A0A1D2JF77_PARBR|nr:hypothetical protein ACO22_03688 [Paracoccidioides brasiliensis]